MSVEAASPARMRLWERPNFVPITALITWSLLMLALCDAFRKKHDYGNYVQQWRLVLNGADPWSTDNAYGPLHNVIALLLPFGVLVPKFFMVGALLAANFALAMSLLRTRGMSPILVVYLAAVPTNVLTIGVGVTYGLNDALVAAFVVAAILFRFRDRLFAAGAMIGLAALLKYYPLLLLPLFALNGRRLEWSVIAAGVAIFCVGMIAAFAVWGESAFHGIGFGVNRHAKLLSIIHPLEHLLSGAAWVRWSLQYNAVLVVSAVAAVFLWAWKNERHWLEAAVLGYLAMLIFYKCGNQQYYLPWLFMVAALPLVGQRSADRMAIILLPVVLLLSLYQFGYEFGTDQYHNQLGWVRDYGGLIAFPVGVLAIAVCMILTARGSPPRRVQDSLADRGAEALFARGEKMDGVGS